MYATIKFILNFFEMSEAILRKSLVTASIFPFTLERSFMTSRSHPLKNLSMISPFLLFLLVTQAFAGKHFLLEVKDKATLETATNKSKVVYFHLQTFSFLNSFKSSKQTNEGTPPGGGGLARICWPFSHHLTVLYILTS